MQMSLWAGAEADQMTTVAVVAGEALRRTPSHHPSVVAVVADLTLSTMKRAQRIAWLSVQRNNHHR